MVISKSVCSSMMVLLLLVGGLAFLSAVVPVCASSITVPDDYPTIQEAINAADQGDEIFVRAGLYPENIVVDKTIALRGESREATIGSGSGTCVSITSDKVTFTGFTIKDGQDQGISITSSMCLVADNNINGMTFFGGIFLDGRYSRVEGNIIFNNSICGNDDCGITVYTSGKNSIVANKINQNLFVGLFLMLDSSFNLVSDNELVGNNDAGICLGMNCCNNTIVNNDASENGWKWGPYDADWINASLYLHQSSCYNRISGNCFSNSQVGVQLETYSDNNMIYHNAFINNTVQLVNYDSCAEFWDDGYPSGGNYWSDYSGVDSNSGPYQNVTGSDGIGDVPYTLDQINTDHYPLMEPYSQMLGDVNDDRKVDMRDVGLACSAFGSCAGSPDYNVMADVNLDLRIDLRDLGIICLNFMKY